MIEGFAGLEVSLLREEKLKVVMEESRSNKGDLKKIRSGADLPGVKCLYWEEYWEVRSRCGQE